MNTLNQAKSAKATFEELTAPPLAGVYPTRRSGIPHRSLMYKALYWVVLAVLVLGIPASSPAQQSSLKAPIVAEYKLLGLYAFTYQGKKLIKVSEFESVMADCPEARSQLRIARSYEKAWWRLILGTVAGGLIGVVQCSAIGFNPYGSDIDRFVFGFVTALWGGVVAAMFYERPIDKYCKEAVDIYNASIGQNSGTRSLYLEGAVRNGS